MVANTLASFYIEENLKAREEQAVGTADFLRLQLQEMQDNLEQQELLLSEFKDRHIGELPQHQEVNLSTLERLNGRLRLNNDNQIQIRDRRAELEKELAEAQGMGPGGPDGDAAQLTQMKQDLAAFEGSYTDKHPDVIRLRNAVATLEEKLRSSRDVEATEGSQHLESPYIRRLEESIRELDASLSALEAEANRFADSISQYQRRVENAPRRETEYQILARDYETTQERYRSLLTRQIEAELAENMEQRQKGEQFRILDTASVPERPAAPNRVRMNLIVLFLSLVLAAGVTILAEQVDTSFHSVDALRVVARAPILVSVPQIITTSDRRRERSRFAAMVALTLIGLPAIVAAAYFLATENTQLTSLLLR